MCESNQKAGVEITTSTIRVRSVEIGMNEQIKLYFERYGAVKSVHIQPECFRETFFGSTHFALVDFHEPVSADVALLSSPVHQVDGHKVNVCAADPFLPRTHSTLHDDFKQRFPPVPPISTVIRRNDMTLSISSQCMICAGTFEMRSDQWIEHYTSHTGEYQYMCKMCPKVLLTDFHDACHSLNNERIRTFNFVRNKPINAYLSRGYYGRTPRTFANNALIGYLCQTCCWIQLSKDQFVEHYDNAHQQICIEDRIDELIYELPLLVETEKTLSSTNFLDMNDFCCLKVFEYVSSNDVKAGMQTCKRLYELLKRYA